MFVFHYFPTFKQNAECAESGHITIGKRDRKEGFSNPRSRATKG